LFRKTLRVPASAGSGLVWDRNRMLDYPAAVSNNVPGTLSKGTSSGNCHAIIFGDWSSLLIGTLGAFTIVVDPYSLKKQGLVEVQYFLFADTTVRRVESFAANVDAKLS
jgi:hypothetical protein